MVKNQQALHLTLTAMARAVVVFDFDATIIDGDGDHWIVNELGLNHLFTQLQPTLPHNLLMVALYFTTFYKIFRRFVVALLDVVFQIPYI